MPAGNLFDDLISPRLAAQMAAQGMVVHKSNLTAIESDEEAQRLQQRGIATHRSHHSNHSVWRVWRQVEIAPVTVTNG